MAPRALVGGSCSRGNASPYDGEREQDGTDETHRSSVAQKRSRHLSMAAPPLALSRRP